MPESPDFTAIALLGFPEGSDVASALTAAGRRVVELDRPDRDLLSDVDLVIEAGTNDLPRTRATFADVAGAVRVDVPMVTAGPVHSVTDIASAVPHPERVAGLHFFQGGPADRTVEVVRALQSAEDLIARLVTLVQSLDSKVPVVVKDRPGFLLNALFVPYLNDVVRELDDELATAQDIDLALQLGLGYEVGPLELLDRMGLDVHLRTTQALFDATGDARFAPPTLLSQMVAAGRLGRHRGGGFRDSDSVTDY